MNQPTVKMTSMIVYVIFLTCMIVQITASAIPMWEFLSRDEKMNYIYRVFTKQMTDFCSTSSRPDCTKNVLFNGVQNLANMDDTTLDRLDPYQRGAEEMIWRAMMGTNKFSSRIGNRIEEESYYTNGADPLATSGSETNVVEDETDPMNNYARAGPYLVGPMVIRVYPDGRPVPEDAGRPLPKDDDAEEIKRTRASEEMKKSIANNFYKIPHGRISSKGPRYPNEKVYSNRRISLSTQMKSMPESRHRSNDSPYQRRYHEIVRYY